jgi:uncharacterized protein YjiS (DUF1127 family)
MRATATPLPSATSHASPRLAVARTPHAAGVDVSRPSANAAEIDMPVAEKRSPFARMIALWEAQAAAFRPVALDVGPWLPSEAARHAAAVGTGSIVSAAVHAVAGRIAAAWKARQQRRAAMRDIEILRQLDDATLRDIGVLRDDIAPTAYENARRRAGG